MDSLAEAKRLFMDALALQEKGDLTQAEVLYRQALLLAPERPSVMNNLAAVCFRLEKYAEAMQLCERLLQINPRDLQALLNLGSCQIGLGLTTEALASYESVLEFRPDDVDALNNLGNALVKLQRPNEALAYLQRALAINPRHLDALQNHGNALLALGQPKEALASFKRALALAPLDAAVQYKVAIALLFCQEFELAWSYYTQRFHSPAVRQEMRKDVASIDIFASKIIWTGSALEGQVAIWAEQGIGDHILFSTLIPELVEAGVSFVYEVDRRLLEAYRRAFPKGQFVPQESPLNPALLQAGHALPAGSLPGLYRCSKESFTRQPQRLLHALPERRAHYRDRMDALGPGLKVAFAWQSTRGGPRGLSKGTALMQFAPLLALPGVHFVDVQYGDTRAERGEVERVHGVRLLHFDEVDYYNDLEEVLAILEACDLLITTSNANAHFAGALGKPVWLLYPAEKPPFHYWAHDGSHHCLWYPSVEIISAPHLTDWPQLVEHVKARLGREAVKLAQGT